MNIEVAAGFMPAATSLFVYKAKEQERDTFPAPARRIMLSHVHAA